MNCVGKPRWTQPGSLACFGASSSGVGLPLQAAAATRCKGCLTQARPYLGTGASHPLARPNFGGGPKKQRAFRQPELDLPQIQDGSQLLLLLHCRISAAPKPARRRTEFFCCKEGMQKKKGRQEQRRRIKAQMGLYNNIIAKCNK